MRPPPGTQPLALLLSSRDRIDQTGPQALRETCVTERRCKLRVDGTASALEAAAKSVNDFERGTLLVQAK
jgi:hypothetical protein